MSIEEVARPELMNWAIITSRSVTRAENIDRKAANMMRLIKNLAYYLAQIYCLCTVDDWVCPFKVRQSFGPSGL